MKIGICDLGGQLYHLKFSIAGLPKTTNGNSRRHWRALHVEAKRWQRYTMLAVGYKKPPQPLLKAHLTFTRHSSQAPDFDGLVSSFKHIQDGLIYAGVIENDRLENIGQPTYLHEKTPPKHGFVTIEIREIVGSMDGPFLKTGL